MNAIIEDFLVYIRSEKGLSPHTVEAYLRDIEGFLVFLESFNVETAVQGGKVMQDCELESLTTGGDHSRTVKAPPLVRDTPDVKQATQEQIIDYLAWLHTKGYAISTVCRNLISIKVLFRFLKREGIVEHNPAYCIDSPKLWQLLPDVLSVAEVEALLHQPDPAHYLGARDKAILELLYASGLRVSELCNLKIQDVDDAAVRVFGKGNKERLIPLGKHALAAIDHYLIHFRSQFDSDTLQILFLTQRGKPMDRIAVWRMVKDYSRKAGIVKNISPHTFRHSFATHLLDNGAELRVIQEMLGHASISSTDRYTHVSQVHLHTAFSACHPRK